MSIRLDAELKVRLDQLAAATTHRSKSFLAAEAIREFVEQNKWQIQEIQSAIREAGADDFASDREVTYVFTKWGVGEG